MYSYPVSRMDNLPVEFPELVVDSDGDDFFPLPGAQDR